jgi:hypothetical protein
MVSTGPSPFPKGDSFLDQCQNMVPPISVVHQTVGLGLGHPQLPKQESLVGPTTRTELSVSTVGICPLRMCRLRYQRAVYHLASRS